MAWVLRKRDHAREDKEPSFIATMHWLDFAAGEVLTYGKADCGLKGPWHRPNMTNWPLCVTCQGEDEEAQS
jgi:hypothetical protein